MREEELEKRLQSAFPNIAPPGEDLHTRIQSLYGAITTRKRRAIVWKPVLGGVVLTGICAVIMSRQSVRYVLEKISLATPPRTTYIEMQDYNSNGGEFRRLYWISGEKQRVVTYAPEANYDNSTTSIKIKQGKNVVSWIPGKNQGSLHPYYAPSTETEGDKLSAKNWQQFTWSGPWIVRLPDRIAQGRRQWILQQERTYESAQPNMWDAVTRSRTVWAIDAQTNRIGWKELWTSPQSVPWQLRQRTDYHYDQAMPDSLFEVPAKMRLTTVPYPRTTAPDPVFNPYFPKSAQPPATFIVDWWRAALSR